MGHLVNPVADLIAQIYELNEFIDKLHLSTRTSLQRRHLQVQRLHTRLFDEL